MMSLTRFLRLGVLVGCSLAALATVACGEQTANDAPIIDTVDAPLVVAQQNGAYAIPVTVLFHDNDGEAVTRLHYRLAPDIDGIVDVPEPNPTRESALVTIVIPVSALEGEKTTLRSARADDHDGDKDDHGKKTGDARRSPRTLQLSVVDGRGAESLPSTSTVTLD